MRQNDIFTVDFCIFREFIFPTPLIERLIQQDEILIIDFESFKQLCNS